MVCCTEDELDKISETLASDVLDIQPSKSITHRNSTPEAIYLYEPNRPSLRLREQCRGHTAKSATSSCVKRDWEQLPPDSLRACQVDVTVSTITLDDFPFNLGAFCQRLNPRCCLSLKDSLIGSTSIKPTRLAPHLSTEIPKKGKKKKSWSP